MKGSVRWVVHNLPFSRVQGGRVDNTAYFRSRLHGYDFLRDYCICTVAGH